MCTHTHAHSTCNRTYNQLVGCLVDDDSDEDVFVDADWLVSTQVKVVEAVDEFPDGWRTATVYQLRANPEQVCLYFGEEEYEGLDEHYSFIDGVLRDSDGVRVELVEEDVIRSTVDRDADTVDLVDPELKELEETGGGYLSNSDDHDFLFGGDGDKKIVKQTE